jgi:hypothetical protein
MSWRAAGSLPDEVIGLFEPQTMALGVSQLLIEISTRNLPGCKMRSACMADHFSTICEPSN